MAGAAQSKGHKGWVAALMAIGVLLMIGMCSSPKKNTAQSFASPSLTGQIEAMPTPAPAPIAPLSRVSLRQGRLHLATVLQAEGLSGAMVYSQNCYDALSREFSWGKLDVCGGFDMLAVGSAESMDTSGLRAETDYFGSEAAAGRYLAIATKAGEEAGDADKRLEALQQRAAALSPAVKPTSTPEIEEVQPASEVPLDNEAVEPMDA